MAAVEMGSICFQVGASRDASLQKGLVHAANANAENGYHVTLDGSFPVIGLEAFSS